MRKIQTLTFNNNNKFYVIECFERKHRLDSILNELNKISTQHDFVILLSVVSI